VIGTSTASRVSGTDVSDITTGITLENVSDIRILENTVTGAQFLGVNASGEHGGARLDDNTITKSGGLGALGHGIYLANASNLYFYRNTVTDSAGAGLYATGVSSNWEFWDNAFEGNRVGIQLVDATGAVIGGRGASEGNRIVGGGDAFNADFRDGIVAVGTLTGSSITKTTITNTATGITLSAATGLVIDRATVSDSQVWGLNASGVLTNTQVKNSTFTLTTGGAGGGAGVLLSAAQSLAITDAKIDRNVIGLLANGDCSGSIVIDTTWGNTTEVINTSTGVPALDINPPPPA